ncbi:hypothetical protein HYC85_000088 [Camellia sinensis]|uniref:Uncharacterized protein n=1 Tax=Camellia sinensis TaxID=4442 RepID=A0A7J7FP78_CAMSI|nr:hypothetical protein HYC85_000088 [Camellia sinensis]
MTHSLKAYNLEDSQKKPQLREKFETPGFLKHSTREAVKSVLRKLLPCRLRMFIADAYKDGVTRKVTVCVRYVTRWPFKPGYIAPPPMFQLGSIPMNFRYFCDSNIVCGLNVFIKGNWEISRRDPNNPCFIAMVTTESNFVDPDYDEYAAFESRSLFCCHSVAAIFMVLLILRHTLPILVNGAQDYSFPLFLLLLLRTTGIIVPINIMVKAVNAIKCCQRQRINSVATIPQFTHQSLNDNTTADKSDYLWYSLRH